MATMEERLAALESEMAQLREQVKTKQAEKSDVIGRTRPDFLDRFFGMYAENPEAQEVLHSVNAERERQREEARCSATEDEQP